MRLTLLFAFLLSFAKKRRSSILNASSRVIVFVSITQPFEPPAHVEAIQIGNATSAAFLSHDDSQTLFGDGGSGMRVALEEIDGAHA